MPDAPPAVGTVAAELRSLTAALRRDFAAASTSIDAELAELLARWPSSPQPVRIRNLRALQANVGRLMRSSRALARDALPEAVTGAYQLGGTTTAIAAQRAATFAAIDRASVAVLAQDAFGDLLAATEHMEDTTKDVVRRLARDHARDRLLLGRTATQAGRRLQADLAGQGISAIVYRDGSNHSLRDYSDMVLRTKTAEAFQVGGFNQGRALGIEWFEILDNPSCGLDGHNDPTKANGLIVRRETAERFPLSHPRCVRVSTARPDIRDEAHARSTAALSSAAEGRRVADQALVEMAREETAARRAGRSVRGLQRNRPGLGTRLEERANRLPDGRLAPAAAAPSRAARARAGKAQATAAPGSTASRARAAKVTRRTGVEAPVPAPASVLTGPEAQASLPNLAADLPRVDHTLRGPVVGDPAQLEATALSDYAGAGFARTNGVLRDERGLDVVLGETDWSGLVYKDGDRIRQTIAGMDSLLERSVVPQPIEVYRGLFNVDAWWGKDASLVGRTLTDEGFTSTTVNREVATKFVGRYGDPTQGAVMRIRVPAGGRALRVDGYEDEIVLARGGRYRVLGDSRDEAGVRTIDVELEVEPAAPLPPEPGPAGTPADELARLEQMSLDELDELAARRPELFADEDLFARYDAAVEAAQVREVDLGAAVAKRAAERTAVEERAVQRFYADMQRRDAEVAAIGRAERDLLPKPHADRATAALREQYDLWLEQTVLDAENATHGLLSREAAARGVSPASLWSGNAVTAVRNASEELIRWWQADPSRRFTYTEWRGRARPGLAGAARASREAFEAALKSADDIRAGTNRAARRSSGPRSAGDKLLAEQRKMARERARIAALADPVNPG